MMYMLYLDVVKLSDYDEWGLATSWKHIYTLKA